ncbi:oligosaccharide flippase family protein [Myxosarcina sp. GI1]|uniref:oligosaccharide flippase family protein n=1 Tax=Myxosarcina sp. GI1 TaxID=1541065 RepID=UPI00056A126C|nr:oligosaccharide flippase family protein [Myxosarcina sp. GI1]
MNKNKVRQLWNKLFQNTILNNTRILIQSFAFRLFVQLIYFVILTRTFGPERYGLYVGVIAFISIFIPFASWGSGEILIKNVSRNQSLFGESWGTAILKTLIFGSIFILIVLIVFSVSPISGISIYSIFFLALANLILMKVSDLARDAFVSVGMLKYAARVIVILSINRFLASLAFVVFFEFPTLLIWSILYCLATLVTTIISCILVVKIIGYPRFKLPEVTQELRQGFAFSIDVSAQNIYNDLDKSMLAKMSTAQAAGIYGAAYNILSVALIPLQSILIASFRDFFQQGTAGIKSSFNLCKKLLPLATGYSLLAIAGIFIFAPLLPKLIGANYSDSVVALMWLSPVIFFSTVRSFAASTLTGANYQSTRSVMQVAIAILNGILNFWLIPLYQWHGAIWATLISEVLLMLSLWICVYMYSRS